MRTGSSAGSFCFVHISSNEIRVPGIVTAITFIVIRSLLG